MSLSHAIGKKQSADSSGAAWAGEFSPAGPLGPGWHPALSSRERPGGSLPHAGISHTYVSGGDG